MSATAMAVTLLFKTCEVIFNNLTQAQGRTWTTFAIAQVH